MNKELIIEANADEISIALLDNKKLVELNQEKTDSQFAVGDIYLGKVKKLMPSLNAAFVDVGYEKDAFLHYHDLGAQFQTLGKFVQTSLNPKSKSIPLQKFRKESDINKDGKITDVIKSGNKVLVQIVKEPISTKGPRLCSEISIAGRSLVLMPLSSKVSVSQKITSAEERNRLRTLIQSIKPQNFGVIVRTVAEGKKVAELDAELRELVGKWDQAFKSLQTAQTPQLVISELNRTSTIVRDLLNQDFNKIVVNDEKIFGEIKQYINSIAPDKEKIVKLYAKNEPIFERFGINKQIKLAFGKTVTFKDSAYLIIEHTEALHVIDVNSGNRSRNDLDQERNALEVNTAAAKEIARQLRLRDMGGIIVVDFIDMTQNENKQKLFEAMKGFMEIDRTKHNILPLTKFGLMQITRQRVRPEMHIETREVCPTCKGSGKLVPSILFVDELETSIGYVLSNGNHKRLYLRVHPYIHAYLTKGMFNISRKWSKKFKCRISVVADNSFNLLQHTFLDKDMEEILDD